MDLKQLQYYLSVAEAGSFSRASKLLGVAQPALGHQVKKLEDEFQLRLMTRHSRGIELTPEGLQLLERARRVVNEAEQLQVWLQEIGNGPKKVSLGMTPSASRILARPLLDLLRRQKPLLRVTLIESMSYLLVEWVLSGRIDMALGHGIQDDLYSEPLACQPLHLISRPDISVGSHREVPFGWLAGKRLVLPGAEHSITMAMEEEARRQGVAMNIVHNVHSIELMCELVRDSDVFAVMPLEAVRTHMQAGTLKAHLIVAPEVSSTLALMHAGSRSLTPSQYAVWTTLRQMVKDEAKREGSLLQPLAHIPA